MSVSPCYQQSLLSFIFARQTDKCDSCLERSRESPLKRNGVKIVEFVDSMFLLELLLLCNFSQTVIFSNYCNLSQTLSCNFSLQTEPNLNHNDIILQKVCFLSRPSPCQEKARLENTDS